MRNKQGFTVLETVIVLAIGGLIILVAFYAVPALNRSTRNTQRKNDATIILDKLSSYQLNNSGAMPSDGSFLNNAQLSIYKSSSIAFDTSLSASDITIKYSSIGVANTTEYNTDINKIYIINFRHCNQAKNASDSNAAGFRDVVALYGIESGSSSVTKCLEL